MSSAPGIAVIAGTATFGNEWLQTNKPNWKVIPATAIAALIFAGFEKVNQPAARGLAALALVTTLIAPVGTAEAPVTHLAQIMGYTGKAVS